MRGRTFVGTVVDARMQQTATVTWESIKYHQKYERYSKEISSVKVHNPENINAKPGDIVRIRECRPLSKTKHFVIVEKIGSEHLFAETESKKLEAKKPLKKKVEVKE